MRSCVWVTGVASGSGDGGWMVDGEMWMMVMVFWVAGGWRVNGSCGSSWCKGLWSCLVVVCRAVYMEINAGEACGLY